VKISAVVLDEEFVIHEVRLPGLTALDPDAH
jgi:hypothetical protein